MYKHHDRLKVRKRFEKLNKEFKNLFYYGCEVDSWLMEIMLIPYITLSWKCTPTWVRIIAPSSSGKSAHLSLLHDFDLTFVMDEMTPKALISGFRSMGDNPSKLPQLDNKVLLISDESTMMEQRAEDRGIIQALLRKAYDGKVAKGFGNITEVVKAEAYFNILAAATPAIDRYFSYTQALGERYINFRLQIPCPKKLTDKAYENQFNNYRCRHDRLKVYVHKFLNHLPRVTINDIEVPSVIRKKLTSCANFVVRMRTHIARDSSGRYVTTLPRQESAGRFVQQLLQVCAACAIIHGKKKITEEILNRAIYTSVSSVPDILIFLLYTTYILTTHLPSHWFTIQTFVTCTGIGRNTISQTLENFAILKIVKVRKTSSLFGKSMEYSLGTKSLKIINNLDFFKYYRPPVKILSSVKKLKGENHDH